MNLSEFFPYKICINLDRRKDRWERMQTRFAQHDIDQVVRFSALDGQSLEIPALWDDFPGAYGCLRSHLAVVEQAREQAKENVLIFEDDAVLAPQFNHRFAEYVAQLPDDWDMLLLGGIHGEPLVGLSSNVRKVTSSLSTYAYALKRTIYDRFIELNRQALTVLDENTRALQKDFNCYCFMPHLAWVEEDYSDVREERSNPWWLKESLVLWGEEVDEILRKTAAIIYHRRSEGSQRSLSFILNYFSRWLPSVALVVVEQADEPGLNIDELPFSCRLGFLQDSGGCQRSRAFNLGFEMCESSRDFFIFLDSDIFITRDDLKANLLMCRENEFVSSFSELCSLNEEDTMKLLNKDLRWGGHYGNCETRKQADICSSGCIFTRRGIRLIGGWDPTDDQTAALTAEKVARLLRLYDSPNPARRLARG